MTSRTPRAGRRGGWLVPALLLLGLVGALTVAVLAGQRALREADPVAADVGSLSAVLVPAPTTTSTPPPSAEPSTPEVRPISVTIPSLAVTRPLVDLRRGPAGELSRPPAPALVGWFVDGPVPGGDGVAVLTSCAGGPFDGLATLGPGAVVEVRRADGDLSFRVEETRLFPGEPPAADVFAPAAGPELRLVLCGAPAQGVLVRAVPL